MARKMKLLITGGAGFIGSNFILKAVKEHHHSVVNIDLLTYASNKKNLEEIDSSENYRLIEGSMGNKPLIDDLLKEFEPDAIINFAAESHVDRSIKNSSNFITTNILGTHELLTSARQYWDSLNQQKQTQFRFLQISTDEVYGSLKPDDPPLQKIACYDQIVLMLQAKPRQIIFVGRFLKLMSCQSLQRIVQIIMVLFNTQKNSYR